MCLRSGPRLQRVYVVLSNAHTLVHGEKPRSAVNASCAVYGEAPSTPFLPLGAGHLTAGVNPAKSASLARCCGGGAPPRIYDALRARRAIGHGQPTLCVTLSYRWLVIVYAVQSVTTRRQMGSMESGPHGQAMQWVAVCIEESKSEQQVEHTESTRTAVRRNCSANR